MALLCFGLHYFSSSLFTGQEPKGDKGEPFTYSALSSLSFLKLFQDVENLHSLLSLCLIHESITKIIIDSFTLEASTLSDFIDAA